MAEPSNIRKACLAIVLAAVALAAAPVAAAETEFGARDIPTCVKIDWDCEPYPCVYHPQDPLECIP